MPARRGRSTAPTRSRRSCPAARERTQGAEHPMLAPTLLNLSTLCEQRGARAAARAFPVRAAAVLDGAVTADHPHRLAARDRLAALDAGGEAPTSPVT
jgi:hypothetical protein